MVLVSGCSTVPTDKISIFCDGLEVPIKDHADALVKDGGPLSQQSGVKLIGAIDAGCA